MVEHNHLVSGSPCKNPDCWCNKFPKKQAILDVVNNPTHYKLAGLEVEALDVIKASLSKEEFKGYLLGNMLKYIMRHKKKNNMEDIRKMLFYSKELDKCL